MPEFLSFCLRRHLWPVTLTPPWHHLLPGCHTRWALVTLPTHQPSGLGAFGVFFVLLSLTIVCQMPRTSALFHSFLIHTQEHGPSF